MALTRRGFLGGAVGAAALVGLGACSSKHSDGTSSDAAGSAPASSGGASTAAGSKASSGPVTGKLTFAFWGGSVGETAGFTYAKKKFEEANPGATVQLKAVPYDGFFSGIDRGIQAGNAPDIFRVDYTTIGKYSAKGVLLDLTPYVSAAESDAFLPALWEAVKFDGKPYGVPHQTDTTCIVYNKAAFASAGITAVPDKLSDAWTWEEFSDVATKLRSSLPDNKFPFAYDWTQAGAYRWLSWLYQAGGTLLTPDLKGTALPSAEATKAMDFTKSFFDNKWVPKTNTIKTSVYSDNFFLNQTVPMTFIGDFLVPELADAKSGYKGGDWGATYMPQSTAAASDLGGNAIVALKDTKNPDLAAAFLKFLVTEDCMKYFCEQAIELPTLKSLSSESLQYVSRPDVVAVCAQQAATISDTVVKESTVPAFASINTLLQDQLELAFHNQSSEATLKNIASGVTKALAG
ncbi:multiple sugar transport system substrate-binding protein [Motilibacter peucedani]|uniref:Multiple sugar transport system substrate-binding protein n=1 Tax=Motilibacter peucedani TaxID=598650 RepID=A0A420XMH8_9ACTN|nr:sugar ABC transporter substrate-binding protein [Motilibacter peucedani]RKS72482.1 multiple sugar transport system substrate-binding protein [Motilibacter peucedani]